MRQSRQELLNAAKSLFPKAPFPHDLEFDEIDERVARANVVIGSAIGVLISGLEISWEEEPSEQDWLVWLWVSQPLKWDKSIYRYIGDKKIVRWLQGEAQEQMGQVHFGGEE